MTRYDDPDSPTVQKKRSHENELPSSSGSSSSDEPSRKKHRRSGSSKKNHSTRKNGDSEVALNGAGAGALKSRRNSLGKAARDPRDEPPKKRRVSIAGEVVPTRSPTPVVDFDGLSRPSRGTRERREENAEQAEARLQKMRGAVRTLLECVGEDPDREGLLDTPSRYAKALLSFTQGYQDSIEDIVNRAVFREGHNEMVIVKDIEVFSLCEHHLVPFTGKMHIGYIPKDNVIGISKLPRIADMFSRRLQIQERLTKEVAHAVMETLKPQGVAVVMEASHLCMVMRGVQKTTATTITSCMLGCFERKSKTRNEFLSLIGVNR
ncbi:hypothetical protein NLU13_9593 [Sarocladium strictum]|uniref:GTP cyclohydrolase 1 n=1 Tax=Sarocladium strictum TaxID=5046 RepID=A0AA39GCM6_SARSR|nr:hypothetical protein NLU13_9593 [Sarocladium strictum]